MGLHQVFMMELTPPIAAHAPLRKHADPPGLWLIVLGGSVLLNGAIALLLHDYFQRLETAAIAPSPIAIALVSSATGNAVTPASAAPARPAPSAARPAAPAPSAPAKLALANPKPQAPRLAPAPPVRPEERRPTPEPPPAPADPGIPEPGIPEPRGDRNDLRETALSTTPEPSPPPPPVPNPDEQVARSGISLPGFAAPPDPATLPTSGTATPPAIALNSSSQPLEVVLQVNLGDRGQLPAQQFKTFVSGEGGCIVTPDALHSFNQPLDLSLTLDAQGNVTATTPANKTNPPTDNPSYIALAQCFLKTLTFPPGESSSPASPNPRVTVILQKR